MHPTTSLYSGAGVALLTLFDAGGTLLTEETARYAALLADSGAACVLVAGTTGEFWTLTREERLGLVRRVREVVPRAVPVMAGIGALDAAEALALAADVGDTGADAALCFVPRGEAPADFYAQIRDAVGELPLLAYHFPAVGYTDVAVSSLPTLPIDGIKDSSGDPARLLATAQVLPAGVYTGSALLAGLAAALETDGALLATANVEPAAAQAAVRGDVAAQRLLVSAHTAAAGEAAPRGLKRLASERFGIPPHTRSPSLAEASGR